MVLWEITLGTAYFLGLKRTYRLALKIQRRLIKPKHAKLRQFVQRRVRAAFDVAVSVHKNIQQRDIEVGRNLGNWILRWLDRMKPSAQIRGQPEVPPNSGNPSTTKLGNDVCNDKTQSTVSKTTVKGADQDSGRHLFSTTGHSSIRSFPTTAITMRPPTYGNRTQYRQFFGGALVPKPDYGNFGYKGVLRDDIRQWMLQSPEAKC